MTQSTVQIDTGQIDTSQIDTGQIDARGSGTTGEPDDRGAPIGSGRPRGAGAIWATRFRVWTKRAGLIRKAAYALTLMAMASGLGTYVTFTSAGAAGPEPKTVLGLLYLNLFFMLLLGALVAYRVVRIWAERRRGLAGSRLHVRLAVLFSAVAVAPTIIVSVFSIMMFDFGIRDWFSHRVRSAIESSEAVAAAYLEEHRQTIRGDALAMANDLNQDAINLMYNPALFAQVVSAQAAVRNLTEAVVVEGGGRILARTGLSIAFEFEPLPEDALRQARAGDVVILTSDSDDRIRALVRLDQTFNAYLFVGRFVDPAILSYVDRSKEAATQYMELEGQRFDIQLTFVLIFAMVALLLLLAAIWIGLNFATRLARPVSDLITAAERVSAGDLSARVSGALRADEIGMLSRGFNRMTRQLEGQRRELVDTNRQLDTRRRFTEAVLAGVSAGVIGLDEDGRINLPNRSAARLLGRELSDLMQKPLVEAVPEMADLMREAREQPRRVAEEQIDINRSGRRLTLLARISAELDGGKISGFVATFDDISELLSAQRKAAWADVARRIAHEIKNPLTPIQLAAERLKRKYQHRITDDRETFEVCTDTIVRQVEDIGRMVDEFSAFARMPAPVMREEDLVGLVREQLVLQRSARSDIRFALISEEDRLTLRCDARQVRQVLTNLLQNAVDAIEASEVPRDGEVNATILAVPGAIRVEISDNGRGLPPEDRDSLTEPYVTTREKGTGLGLAIVKKIMEDHDGQLDMHDRDGGGAVMSLLFPLELDESLDGSLASNSAGDQFGPAAAAASAED